MSGKSKRFARAAALAALMLGAGALGTASLDWDAAYAKNGNGNGGGNNGNGNGNGNGNNGNRSAGGNASATNANKPAGPTGNGRGWLARELKSLNAAHANPNALKNASPGSMPGKLNTYKTSYVTAVTAKTKLSNAQAEITRLNNLTPAEITAEFGTQAAYDAAVLAAQGNATQAQTQFNAAQTQLNVSYTTLTGGRQLTKAALAELHRLLGI